MGAAVFSEKNKSYISPQKFGLWIACASIIMMFSALSSAYIVRKSAGNWLEFKLPDLFLYSTCIILLSSFTLQLSYNAFKRNYFKGYKLFLLASLCFGVAFVLFQYFGWMEMKSIGIDLAGNPSGSFIYVISGLHAAHVIGGITVLLVACIHAFTLPNILSKNRINRFQMSLQFWHFLGILWTYLYIFFLIQ